MPTKMLPSAHLVILAALIIVPAARGQGATCDRACLGVVARAGKHSCIFVWQSRDDRVHDRDAGAEEIPGAHSEEVRADPFGEVLAGKGRNTQIS